MMWGTGAGGRPLGKERKGLLTAPPFLGKSWGKEWLPHVGGRALPLCFLALRVLSCLEPRDSLSFLSLTPLPPPGGPLPQQALGSRFR